MNRRARVHDWGDVVRRTSGYDSMDEEEPSPEVTYFLRCKRCPVGIITNSLTERRFDPEDMNLSGAVRKSLMYQGDAQYPTCPSSAVTAIEDRDA